MYWLLHLELLIFFLVLPSTVSHTKHANMHSYIQVASMQIKSQFMLSYTCDICISLARLRGHALNLLLYYFCTMHHISYGTNSPEIIVSSDGFQLCWCVVAPPHPIDCALLQQRSVTISLQSSPPFVQASYTQLDSVADLRPINALWQMILLLYLHKMMN
jgi:hypothetical protein